MKKALLMAALVGAVLLSATGAKAATLSFNTHGVGSWQPGTTYYNNDAEVATGVNLLAGYYNTGTAPSSPPTWTLAPSSLTKPLPTDATFVGKDENGPFADVNASQYEYVIGKYGTTTYLFYIGNLSGNWSLPANLGGNNLSHEVWFNATDSPGEGVPDGGATVALLGLGLVALGATRRFIKS